MALHRAFVEMLRVSSSMFMLLCIASTLGIILLMLLVVSVVTSLAKHSGILKQTNRENLCEGPV